MIVSFGFISGLVLGIEFLWDVKICVLHLGIVRMLIQWDISEEYLDGE